MSKHKPKKIHPCPAVNCKKTFYRTDKLKAHIRTGHDEVDYFMCPVKDCDFSKGKKVLLRYEMREHLGGHDGRTTDAYKDEFAVLA
jgi:hypothetical protein